MPRWEDTRRIYEMYRRFVAAFDASSMPAALVTGLCVPKVHDLLHLLVQMILFGALQNLSLQAVEHAHQPLCKRIFDATDRRREDVQIPMTKTLREKEAADLIQGLTVLQFAGDADLSPTLEAATWWARQARKPHTAAPLVRGTNRRFDMKRNGCTLEEICAMTCSTPLVNCDFARLQHCLAALRTSAAEPLTGHERLTTYTRVLVVPQGRQAADQRSAYARPGVQRRDDATASAYNVVRLATRPGEEAASDSHGLLILILSLLIHILPTLPILPILPIRHNHPRKDHSPIHQILHNHQPILHNLPIHHNHPRKDHSPIHHRRQPIRHNPSQIPY
jgi:hypothetical protein